MTTEVFLAVYDLSHGMAKQLSAQFLGPGHAIDIIPHTAVVVFGKEYFFGGGIQHEDPHLFRRNMGIHPIQVLSLGKTSVTQAQFHAWCQQCTQSGRYSPAAYDLLNHNCNNFSHDATIEGLNLTQGVPQWILDVPRTFLSSPMGQMIRPMLENMQVSGGMGGSTAPFANAPSSQVASTSAPDIATAPETNPWAHIPASNGSHNQEEDEKLPANKTTPILDSFCKTLISSDSKTVPLCINKVCSSLQDPSDRECLEQIGKKLSGNCTPANISSNDVEQACQIIHAKVLQQSSGATTFALMLLRVIILQSTGAQPSAVSCLKWISAQLMTSGTSSSLTSHAARAMAWATLSNAASLQWCQQITSAESLLEAAIVDWTVESQQRSEVRQAASAFGYNCVLRASPATTTQGDELSDDRVSLLCASLEGIASEPDDTARLRRLLVAARILVPVATGKVFAPAKNLMQDLGFSDAFQQVVQRKTDTDNIVAKNCKALAKEMLSLLQD
jgi:desumoylating isopeptidase 1